MIGNDVVDLKLAKAESNWQRKGFLDKIYTKCEQNLIWNSTNPETTVWILWSLKESVYKAYQRMNYNRGFYPTKIQIQSLELIKSKYHSHIEVYNTEFYGITTENSNFVHSIVTHKKSDLKKIKNYTANKIVKDDNSLPFCKVSKNPLSVSHHGCFYKAIELEI